MTIFALNRMSHLPGCPPGGGKGKRKEKGKGSPEALPCPPTRLRMYHPERRGVLGVSLSSQQHPLALPRCQEAGGCLAGLAELRASCRRLFPEPAALRGFLPPPPGRPCGCCGARPGWAGQGRAEDGVPRAAGTRRRLLPRRGERGWGRGSGTANKMNSPHGVSVKNQLC